MRGLSADTLQLYEDPQTGSAEERALEITPPPSPSGRHRADQLACSESWRLSPSRHPVSAFEPFTLDWFKQIELRRYSRHGYWIPKQFEFHRHRGEQVLCLGDSLGTDLIQYALNGASVHYCSPSAEAIETVQTHFRLRRQTAQFHRAPLTNLPLLDNSLDVVTLSGLSADLTAPLDSVVDEVFRVLKPGGKVIAALPAKYDARWWQDFWFPWNRWFGTPHTNRSGHWSGRELRQMFERFSIKRLLKRHLRRSDLPHVWRWMLLPCLERVMGRFLIVKAFKPLAAAMPIARAA